MPILHTHHDFAKLRIAGASDSRNTAARGQGGLRMEGGHELVFG